MTVGSAKIGSGGAGAYGRYLEGELLLELGPERYGNYIAVEDARCKDGVRLERPFGHVMFTPDQLGGRAVDSFGPGFARSVAQDGGVTWGRFERLFNGQDPMTGQQLAKSGHRAVYDDAGNKIGTQEARTAAIDLHMAAPKDVSVALAVAGVEAPELARRILAVHQSAVARTMNRIEATATLGRRTVATPTEVKVAAGGERLVTKPGHERQGEVSKQQGSKTERVTVDLVHITATQFSAREVIDGRLPAPHLHSHVAVMAMAHDPATDKFVQIDDYGLKSRAKTFDAWYLGDLAKGLQEIGIELEFGDFDADRNGRAPWRIKGITKEATDFFSPGRDRKWDLQRQLEEASGKAVPGRVIQNVMRDTRRTKGAHKSLDTRPDFKLWLSEAADHGVKVSDGALTRRMRQRLQPIELPSTNERMAEFNRRLDGPNGFAREDAQFDAKSVTEAIARCAEGLSFSDDELAHGELLARQALIVTRAAATPAAVLYTTQAMIEAESAVEASLRAKAAQRDLPRPALASVERAIGSLGVDVDNEQRLAIEQATAGRGLTIIEGWAGTGKTTCLRGVVEAGRIDTGAGPTWDQVVVVSTAALTAKETAKKLTADSGHSLLAFARRVESGRLQPTPATLIVCDEAAMNSTWLTQRFLDAAGDAQVVLVGDTLQAQAVGPGGTFEAAKQAHGAVELTNVHRQTHDADKQALADLRYGASRSALENLSGRGRLHLSETPSQRVDQVLEDYQAHRNAGRSASDVRVIVDSSNVAVDELNRHIQRERERRGEIAPEAVEVRFEDGEARRWMLHQGDHVLFLAADKDVAGEAIANGTTGEIRRLLRHDRIEVATNDGRSVVVAASQRVGLAYASHHVKFQGGERPVILYAPGANTNLNSAYSAGSRAVDELHIYADHETHGDSPMDHLSHAWSHSPAKQTALSQLRRSQQRLPTQNVGRSVRDRRPDLIERTLQRVAGPEVAGQVRSAKAWPALQRTLGDLDRRGADSETMLRRALHERELETAEDPAAVVVHRLRSMRPVAPGMTGLETPIDSMRDPDMAQRQARHLELQRQDKVQPTSDQEVDQAVMPDETTSQEPVDEFIDPMARHLDKRSQAPAVEQQTERPEQSQGRSIRGIGIGF